ncbi:MAG TPA: cytochrome c family protein [Henriciella sp.]|nr:cytochrome c family protein [Henriciella sp.]
MFLRIFLASGAAFLAASCDRTASPDGQEAPQKEVESAANAIVPATSYQAAFDVLPAPYSQADYSLGRRTFKNCQSCHTITEGGRHSVGPNLHGIFGRTVGTAEGFQYSKALEAEDFTWTPERLEEWLDNPRGYLPGNRMTFAGVHRPADRHAVIAYLMVESGYAAELESGSAPQQYAPASEPAGDGDE